MLQQITFIFFSIILRWPIWVMLLFIRPFGLFDYIFLVYPGTQKHLNTYCPKLLKSTRFLDAKPSVLSIVKKANGVRGLVLGVPNFTKEFRENKNLTKKLISNLELIKKITGVSSVAMAGQLPSITHKHALGLPLGFVSGTTGTVFCVIATIESVFKKHTLDKKNNPIAVVGVGYVGSILISTLQDLGYNTQGIDIIKTSSKIILAKDASSVLKKSKVIVALTPRGKDFTPYLKKLSQDSIIIDDTHPKIDLSVVSVKNTFYKVAIGLKNAKFCPKLPGYKNDWLPGCVIEAMHLAILKKSANNQKEFIRQAKKIGFYAHLVK